MKRRTITTALKLLFTVVLLGLIIRRVGLSSLLDRFASMDFRYLAVALVLSVGFTLLKSYKWFYLLHRTAGTGTYAECLRTYLIGIGLAVVTPGRVGELGRAFYVKEGDRAFAAGLVGVDRLLDLAGVFALACAGAFAVAGGWAGWVCAAIAVLVFALLYWPERPARLGASLLHRLPAGRKLQALPDAFRSVSRPTLTGALVLTLLGYGIVLTEYYVLVSAFEPVTVAPVLFVFPLVMLTNIFQITIGGLGVREGASVLLFSLFGVSSETAINATFLIFLFNILVPGLAGALISAAHRRPAPPSGNPA